MPDGGEVRISLNATGVSKRKGDYLKRIGVKGVEKWAQLVVADDGPGIPQDIAEKIFEPFWSGKIVGTGLGLAIARRNAEELGGHIVLESDLNSGSTFQVFLPISRERGLRHGRSENTNR
jgi:signal transduction histidine kinase